MPTGSRRIIEVMPFMYSPGGAALEVARRAGEEPDLVDRSAGSPRDIVSARGLPVFAALDVDELLGARLERVGEPEQRQLPLRRRGVAPHLEALGRGRERPLDVGSPADAAPSRRPRRCRVDDLAGPPVGRGAATRRQ